MKAQSSQYIEQQRRGYSIYIMQMRAIPAATDGLKAAGRRVLWMARDGKKYKSATLAGATMPIHPHASPEDAINTLAAPYGNNIPLLKGDGAFGTLLNPKAYGASRYTAVTVSKFTQDVVFRDIEIIPMQENYDGTLEEPVHFLPLIPIALLNPTEGIAIGFASNILPRSLEDIILAQIAFLKGTTEISDLVPKFAPLKSTSFKFEDGFFYFKGEFEQIDATTIRITQLPYGAVHEKIISKIDELYEKGTVVDYTDNSRDTINIIVKFKKGVLRELSENDTLKLLGLVVRHSENLNVLDFEGKAVWNPSSSEFIKKFTDWRLKWYVNRYQRLYNLIKDELQRYYDIRTAIKHNAGNVARKCKSRAELKEWLETIKIVNLDYIADLPIYRFTADEDLKNEERIKEAEAKLKEYNDLLSSETKRRNIYINELEQILKNFNKGVYD